MQTTQTKVQPIPYLFFDGNCAEAMRFYEQTFEGKIKTLMTYGEMPGGAQCDPAKLDLVMNCALELPGGGQMMAGDSMFGPYNGISEVMLALIYDTVEEAETIFKALAVGGEVTMELCDTFWSTRFGMLKDRFGVAWAVNGEMKSI